jgi:serine/threonine-protein phosphatase 4 catalytic subunit
MDLDSLISRLREAESPTSEEIHELLALVTPLFHSEPNVLHLDPPLTICGDTHGQLFDLLMLFEVSGGLPGCRYLFIGDYVDRGYYSVELICLLFCYKAKFPTDLFLLRGNHETRAVNIEYGFSAEIQTKYGDCNLWGDFNAVFDTLPIAAVVDGRLFCVHGGLHPELGLVGALTAVDRFQEPDANSLLAGLLWSDPDEKIAGWEPGKRTAGWRFSASNVANFLTANSLGR